jgi:glycosyltransferase involved in cell wall biosynthesis
MRRLKSKSSIIISNGDLTSMAESFPGKTGLVSVIVPTYNREKIVGATIEGILEQTYGDIEVLVVDDGSQDDTESVVASYLRKDPRVSYHKKENGGVGSARNLGIERARGEFIAFCDSDDIWLPDKLESQLPLFGDPKVVLVHGRAVNMDQDGNLSRLT